MFTVIEIQNGIVGGNVWAYENRNDAYAKFYAVLSVAAVSGVAVHSAAIFNELGEHIDSKYFVHQPEEAGPEPA